MSTLTINLNEEYRIKIENGNDFHNSIFEDIYLNAVKNVGEIIFQSDGKSKYDDFNNLIAFTGERGKGKSSSMISFRNALIDKKTAEHEDFFEENNSKNESLKPSFHIIRNRKFAEIDIIDPSLFKDNESLFEIVLAKMFSKFQKELIATNSNISDDVRRQMISLFQSVFENLQIINTDRKELYKLETIEALSKLAISSNLRDCFKDLVSYYLDNFENKDFLLVAIDDFDLNISGAYEMLEDIRQFLIQNKIIILVACKVEQLHDALILYFKNLKLYEDVENKANRYLDKLLPFSRRLSLPNVNSISNLHLKIESNNKLIFDNSKSNLSNSIYEVIYKNFDIFIGDNKFRKNNIIPKTIRETQYFFKILDDKKNYSLLRKYIIEEINKNKIYVNEFDELENCNDSTFNLLFIRKLYSIIEANFTKDLHITFRNRYEAFKISNSKLPENISFGDTFYLITELQNFAKIDDWKINEFLDYIKFYYIVRIHNMIENLKNLNFIKLGFYNGEHKIISEERGINSRVFIEFKNQIELNNLNNSEKFIISMFVYLLGDSKNYRNDFEKEKLVIGYKKGGILTPFSVFSNYQNINLLSDIFEYDKTDSYILNSKEWFKSSKLIEQLCNPYFTLELFSELNKFRTREIKETLPENSYFDVICLLFIYGIIDGLKKMEDKYDYISKLSFEFANNPIIKSLVNKFISNPNNLKFKKVNEINSIYFINLFDNNQKVILDEEKITDEFCTLLNNLYVDSTKEEIVIESSILSPNLRKIISELYKNISKKPSYTFRSVSPYIKRIEQINETSFLINDLLNYKSGLKDSFDETNQNLKDYLKNLINGQSS